MKRFVLGCALVVLACPAVALKGYDESNKCEVELKGNYKLEGLDVSLKEGIQATFYDGCEKRTVKLEVREVNRWEKLDSVGYTIDTLDRGRMDGLRTRRFEMREK